MSFLTAIPPKLPWILYLKRGLFERRPVRIVRLRERALRNRTAPYARLKMPPASESFLSPGKRAVTGQMLSRWRHAFVRRRARIKGNPLIQASKRSLGVESTTLRSPYSVGPLMRLYAALNRCD